MDQINWKVLTVLASSISLAGCFSDSSNDDHEQRSVQPLTFIIAHVNDHQSHLDGFAANLTLDGKPTEVELGVFSRLTTLFAQAEAEYDNLLKLHAGDAITGTLYYTFYDGEADADLMNTVCFDAFALGNHEFDGGDEGLVRFLDHLHTGDCDTPVLAANVKPAVGTPLAPVSVNDYIQPYAIKEVEGVRVGIVGIDVAGKTRNSSRPLATTVFENEVESAQQAIDELQADGIEHIVLLTHQGYENDSAATMLPFTNVLVELDITGAEVVQALED